MDRRRSGEVYHQRSKGKNRNPTVLLLVSEENQGLWIKSQHLDNYVRSGMHVFFSMFAIHTLLPLGIFFGNLREKNSKLDFENCYDSTQYSVMTYM